MFEYIAAQKRTRNSIRKAAEKLGHHFCVLPEILWVRQNLNTSRVEDASHCWFGFCFRPSSDSEELTLGIVALRAVDGFVGFLKRSSWVLGTFDMVGTKVLVPWREVSFYLTGSDLIILLSL